MSDNGYQQPPGSMPEVSSKKPAKPLSKNVKKATRNVRAAITRTFTKTKTCMEKMRLLEDRDATVKLTPQEQQDVNELRKSFLAILPMIEKDTHFLDYCWNMELTLSIKEKEFIKKAVADKFVDNNRAQVVTDIKESIASLEQILTDHEYVFDQEITSQDRDNISLEIENIALDPNDEEYDSDGNLVYLSNHFIEPSDTEAETQDGFHLPKKTETPILGTNVSVIRNTNNDIVTSSAATFHPASGVIGSGGAYSSLAFHRPSVRPSIVRTMGSLALKDSTSFIPQARELCLCCKRDHPLEFCNDSRLKRFCAANDLCIVCTASGHKTHECPLRESDSVSSCTDTPRGIMKHDATQVQPIDTSTPRDHEFAHPWKPRFEDAPRNRTFTERKDYVPRFQTDQSDESEEDEYRSPRERSRRRQIRKDLSLYDLEVVVPAFNDNPLTFRRFMSMFESMVMNNPRISDQLKYALLQKKLEGTAQRFLYDLDDPRKALEASLNALKAEFDEDMSHASELLHQFRELTFSEKDYKLANNELGECKRLIVKLRELGEDVDSPLFVRMLVEKLPKKVWESLHTLYANKKQPTTEKVLSTFTNFLKVKNFGERFRPTADLDRKKELPYESVMTVSEAMSTPTASKDRKISSQPSFPNQGFQSRPSEHPAKNFPSNQNRSKQTAQTNRDSKKSNDQSKFAKPQNSSKQDTPRVPKGTSQNNTGKPGNNKVLKDRPEPRNLDQSLADIPGGFPEDLVKKTGSRTRIPQLRGVSGEVMEPCYKFGRGYDRRFIAHTFPLDHGTANKCCFICGPGHSILQCPLTSYQVRQYLRDTNSCHNCAQGDHVTKDCPSFSTCAYCQGAHNTGGCTLKEYYRDLKNYPSDAPSPVLTAFFRGPLGASQ